jgi:hypothetical protein
MSNPLFARSEHVSGPRRPRAPHLPSAPQPSQPRAIAHAAPASDASPRRPPPALPGVVALASHTIDAASSPPEREALEPVASERHDAIAPADEAALAAILAAPSQGETYELAFRRKERAFVEQCASLPVLAAMALHRRLANPRAGDELAAQFGRLVVERRHRILDFLAGARRRAALATAR